MTAILVMLYGGVALLLFKFKILKVRPFPIAFVVLGGILIIGSLIIVWRQVAPMSAKVVTVQYVVQLVPYVKGQVLKIHAKANQLLKKGDLLLEINPAPSQFAFNSAQAQLEAAQAGVGQAKAKLAETKADISKSKANVNQAVAALAKARAADTNAQAAVTKAKAAVENTQAGAVRAKAADELAKTNEEIALDLRKTDAAAISVLRLAQATQARKEADAALAQAVAAVSEARAGEQQAVAALREAQAGEQQADAGLVAAKAALEEADSSERQATFAVKVAESQVPVAQASLDDARFYLEQCNIYAPADGYVVDWMVQEGQMVSTLRMTPAGTFVCTAETIVVAVYPQNFLANVQPGDDVEIVLDTYPGLLLTGKVDFVIPATGEGQFDPSKQIPEASKVGSQGMLAVRIRLTGPLPPDLPLGAGGEVAIYTHKLKPVHVLSKIFLRVKKWMKFVVPA